MTVGSSHKQPSYIKAVVLGPGQSIKPKMASYLSGERSRVVANSGARSSLGVMSGLVFFGSSLVSTAINVMGRRIVKHRNSGRLFEMLYLDTAE